MVEMLIVENLFLKIYGLTEQLRTTILFLITGL